MPGQDLLARSERHARLGEPVVDGERQLDATRAAADYHDPLPTARALEKGKPALAELGDRLDRDCMLGRAWDGTEIGCRADIERQHVIGERRLVLEQHQPAGVVEPDRLGVNEARAGAGRERGEIDVTLVEAVAAGDEAGKHAGIGGADIARDQRHLHTGHGSLAEACQHMDMGMAAAHQHQMLHRTNITSP